jgi:hypothetical protein
VTTRVFRVDARDFVAEKVGICRVVVDGVLIEFDI